MNLPTPSDKIEESQEQSNTDNLVSVIVDVKGLVKYPGVYELPIGSRVMDAIELAGGYLPESDSTMINHAMKLEDEMVIYIPYKGEEIVESVNPIPSKNDDKIDINTADETLLTTLPGIGPSKADAIINYREENGRFGSPEELKNVTGIGDKTFDRLEDLIIVK